MEHDTAPSHQLFDELRALAAAGPVVVAHRGASCSHPENTVPAFAAAAALGVVMQEFDVQQTRDGVLVCCHDVSLDRTTDASEKIGPGALVAQIDYAELGRLDAGSWFRPAFAAARIPTLDEVLTAIGEHGIALIEHKGGEPASYVEALRRLGRAERSIVQSFDWTFVAACHELEPRNALAVLGPIPRHDSLDDAAIAEARRCGAGMVHWRLDALRVEQVRAAHAAGLAVCTYTTDDDAGYLGGAAMGVDAMCTNVPERMLMLRAMKPTGQ